METYEGNLVRLDPIDSETEWDFINRWVEDGNFFQLLDDRLVKIPTVENTKEFIEKIDKEGFIFGIHSRKGDFDWFCWSGDNKFLRKRSLGWNRDRRPQKSGKMVWD